MADAFEEQNANISREDIEALLPFLPIFEKADFKPGRWIVREGQMPYFESGAETDAFRAAVLNQHWMVVFDWGAWLQSHPDANSPQWIATASLDDLRRLLTAIIRSERFDEGALAAAIQAQIITAVLRRLQKILNRWGEASGQ